MHDKVRGNSKPCGFLGLLLNFSRKMRPAGAIIFCHLAYSHPDWRISFSLPCAGTMHEEARLNKQEVTRNNGGVGDCDTRVDRRVCPGPRERPGQTTGQETSEGHRR